MITKNLLKPISYYFPIFILISFVLMLTFVFWLHPLNLPSTFDPDALQHLAFGYVFTNAIHTFNEFPIWNPYFGGGIPWAGMVWNPGISPMSLILILFGEVIGIKLWLFCTYLFGAIGMYLMCHNCLNTSRPAASLAGMLFVGSLWAAGRFISGNYLEFSFLLLPLCIYLLNCVISFKLIGIFSPILYLFALGAFGKYEIFLMMPFILFITIAYRKENRLSICQILIGFILTFIVFIGLSLHKLLPLLEIINSNIAEFRVPKTGLRALEIIKMIVEVTRLKSINNIIGVGVGGVLLVFIAFLLNWRKSLGLALVLIAAFLLTMGPNTPLFHVVNSIPILDTIKSYPKYFNGFILFSLCALTSLGIDCVLPLVSSRPTERSIDRWQWLTIFLIFSFIVLPPSITSFRTYKNGFRLKPFKTYEGDFFHVSEERLIGSRRKYRTPNMKNIDTIMYYNLLRNRGTITWYGNFILPENAAPKYIVNHNGNVVRNEDYKGEIYCPKSTREACDINNYRFTFNTISLELGKEFSANRVVFNFNFHPGWSSKDAKVVNANGLLAVDLNDNSRTSNIIYLRFVDRRFNVGVKIFLVTFIGWLIGYFALCKIKSTSGDK